ncbi:MAG: glycosyltransferase, partial [Candidatus Moraniibacteriota bacterium]
MKISLCLLTFNELAGCKNDIPQIKKIATRFDEIYAIDGGSKDGTVEYLKKENITTHIQLEKGLNAAVHYGLEKCTTDAIIFFHPKGTVPVSDIIKFNILFEKGFEFIIASRNIKKARNEEDDKIFRPRKWAVKALAIFAFILFKKNKQKIIWDVLHGFRGITKNAYAKMHLIDKELMTIDIEMISRAYKLKIQSIEFPTTESFRLEGKTHFKAIPTGFKILGYI